MDGKRGAYPTRYRCSCGTVLYDPGSTIIVILNAVVTYAVVIEHTTVFFRFAAEEAKWIGDVVGKCNSYMYTPYEEATENTSFHIANILLIVYPLLSMKNLVLISET